MKDRMKDRFTMADLYNSQDSKESNKVSTVIKIAVAVFVLLIAVALLFSIFGYVGHSVADDELGIKMRKNQIVEIVGPGIYSDFNLFADMVDVKTSGLQFCAEDEEVLTKDQQRIGIRVCGTVFRPKLSQSEVYLSQWSAYKTFYLQDVALIGEEKDGVRVRDGLMTELSQQAMKVCAGDRTFEDAAVGTARDDLRICIDTELDDLAQTYGLTIHNVIVPNIAIHATVQELLDQITESKFQTDLAVQNALKASAEADRELAEEQGRIRVEQGVIQEQRRQEAVTAGLEKASLEAQLQVIIAQRANELRDAELELGVTEAELAVAEARAKADLAETFLLAGLYEDNPEYLDLLIAQTWAAAWNDVDKVIVPAGTSPNTIINPDNTNIVIPIPGE